VGAQAPRQVAAVTNIINIDIATHRKQLATAGTAAFQQFSVHMDDIAATGPFMKVVNILGDQQHFTGEFRFQSGQGQVGGIGLHCVAQQLLATQIIELVHQAGIGGETFRGGDILNAVFFPQAIGSAKGFNPRLGRNTRPGEYDYSLVLLSHFPFRHLPFRHLPFPQHSINPSQPQPAHEYAPPDRHDPADW